MTLLISTPLNWKENFSEEEVKKIMEYDKLQNAVYANNYEDAMSALESLPPVTAAIFNDLRQQLYAKQERIKLLDELVLSFAKGE